MKSLKLFLFAFIMTGYLFPQHVNIQVGGSINQYEPNEPSIVLDPDRPDRMLVGANSDNFYRSDDGGVTWTFGRISSSYSVNCDPCVMVDAQGCFYYAHLVYGLDKVVVQKLEDFNGLWSNGTYTGQNQGKDNDKEWSTVDRQNNIIYLTWSEFDSHGSTNPDDSSCIKLSSSSDGGVHWGEPVQISDRKGNAMGGTFSMHGSMPAVGPEGEVYVTWVSPEGVMLDKSTDHGVTWLDSDKNITGRYVQWFYNVSGIHRTPGFPVIQIDTSGGFYNGNIYISWGESLYGGASDIWFTKSTDGGSTWSVPKTINDNGDNSDQFYGWLAVDQKTGFIWSVFYDRRNTTGDYTDVYMAVSQDGGESFVNFKVSESSFLPTANDFLGDYNALTAYNNIVRPVWTRADNGSLSLVTAIVDTDLVNDIKDKRQNSLPDKFGIISAYPNPFNPATNIEIFLEKEGAIELTIYNILGEKADEVYCGTAENGKSVFSWDGGNLSSGVYFALLKQNEFVSSIKLLFIK